MGRTPCCSKMGLNRGPWTPQEDELLANYIQKHGEGRWRNLPKKAGLKRCGKSSRLRWMNYLRPDVKRGQILPDEEDLILRLHRLLGNRWSLIAGRIPGRTDNEIKNYWNTYLSKKLVSQGIDPRTHKPLAHSELHNIHAAQNGNNNKNVVAIDSEHKLSSAASDSPDKYPQTATVDENSEASTKVFIEDHHSPDIIEDSELPANSLTGSLNHAFNGVPNASNTVPPPVFQDTASNGAVNMDPTLIPYSNTTSVVSDLQDHDTSLYLRKNSITNSYFMAPPMTDSSLENIACFPTSIPQNAPYEGFPMSYQQSDVQQCIDINPIAPGANAEEYTSYIFSYFLDSFMDGDQFQNETNKHAAPSGSENRQQFSYTETMNQVGYDMWSSMSSASQYP